MNPIAYTQLIQSDTDVGFKILLDGQIGRYQAEGLAVEVVPLGGLSVLLIARVRPRGQLVGLAAPEEA